MEIEKEINQFISNYDFAKKEKIWTNHNKQFQKIWKNRILTGNADKTDFDDLVFIIDSNARNSTKEDEAVAKTYLRYSIWYKFFNDLNEKQDLREKIDEIINTDEDEQIIIRIDELYDYNKNNKNGLTTKNAIILNALLFLNKPDKYISSLSLKHRKQICTKLKLNFSEDTYGNIIVETNNAIIKYFEKFIPEEIIANHAFIKNRLISDYIYSTDLRKYFFDNDNELIEDTEDKEIYNIEAQNFYLEKYLEHFIYTNWDNIKELEDYEFILNEDNEPISLQYNTDVGIIDILVKNKYDKHYLIIELKRGKTTDKTVGQLTRYMGWVKKNIAEKENVEVKGLIIAESFDEKIKYSLMSVPNVKLMKYRINFNLDYYEDT